MWQRVVSIILGWGVVVSCAAPVAVAPESATSVPADVGMTMTPATNAVATEVSSPTVVGTIVPSPTRFIVPTSTPSNVDSVDATAIAATMVAKMPATATPDAEGLSSSLQGDTAVLGLLDRYVAGITLGMMANMNDPHPLTIYEKSGSAFVPVVSYEFAEEYISTLELIEVSDTNKAFFVVSGGMGAHSSFAKVFSFDGKRLTVELEASSAAGGGALMIVDVNQDGQVDLVADNTDYYVFCYACGVRIQGETIYAWNGTTFVEQTLQDSTDPALQLAIDYAQVQRYVDAAIQLQKVATPTTSQDQWNQIIIERMIDLRQPTRDDPYPFLSAIFYGDYDVAVSMLRTYDADELINPDGLLFTNTAADGFVDAVVWNVVGFTSIALEEDSTLTSAQFLRGWANTLLEPRNPAGIADLQAVADKDPFYAAVRDAVVSR
ncbi:MAG: hypothetical protein ACO3F2_07465 [Roseiflexaceae bacterium]